MSVSHDVEINLEFRPSSYLWPLGLEKHLLARIKGAKRKKQLQQLIAEGRMDKIPEFLAQSSLSEEDRRMLGRIHALFMGGEYLPDLSETEVEIARISIQSTTGDVTSMYARRGEGCIHTRVVDEYEGDTLTGITERTSERPLTLGELYQFYVGVWPFMEVLAMNYQNDLDGMLGFFSGDSAFYPQLDALPRQRVRAEFTLAQES